MFLLFNSIAHLELLKYRGISTLERAIPISGYVFRDKHSFMYTRVNKNPSA